MLKKVLAGLIFIVVIIGCKAPKPQKPRYVDYQPFFNQLDKSFEGNKYAKNDLDTVVKILSNLRDEVYPITTTISFTDEFEYYNGELLIDIELINEKPPLFDTFMVVKDFLMSEELMNTLFPLLSDTTLEKSIPIDTLKKIEPLPEEKPFTPTKATMPTKNKQKKRVIKGANPYKSINPKDKRYSNKKSYYYPKETEKPKKAPEPIKPAEPEKLITEAKDSIVKKPRKFFTRQEILSDTTRDLLDADTLITNIFATTGWQIGDSIPLFAEYSNYTPDSSMQLITDMVFVERYDPSREVKQYPKEELTREVATKKTENEKFVYNDKVIFRKFYKDEEDVFITMVKVKGDRFKIGHNEFDEDERPEYGIQVSDFLIGKYETTNEVVCSFLNMLKCDKTGYRERTRVYNLNSDFSKIYWDNKIGRFKVIKGFEKYPAVNITWTGANLIGKTGGGRLPTEAEWEFAAKGGRYAIKYHINSERTDYAYEQRFAGSNTMSNVGWFVDNSGGYYHPVGELMPNLLGIHDMCGNVWEWCFDNYDKEFYKTNGDSTDPFCVNNTSLRANRGGSWSSDAQYCRITNRNFLDEAQCNQFLGFRILKEWNR